MRLSKFKTKTTYTQSRCHDVPIFLRCTHIFKNKTTIFMNDRTGSVKPDGEWLKQTRFLTRFMKRVMMTNVKLCRSYQPSSRLRPAEKQTPHSPWASGQDRTYRRRSWQQLSGTAQDHTPTSVLFSRETLCLQQFGQSCLVSQDHEDLCINKPLLPFERKLVQDRCLTSGYIFFPSNCYLLTGTWDFTPFSAPFLAFLSSDQFTQRPWPWALTQWRTDLPDGSQRHTNSATWKCLFTRRSDPVWPHVDVFPPEDNCHPPNIPPRDGRDWHTCTETLQLYMPSYFCEEETFPNDLSRVNKGFHLSDKLCVIDCHSPRRAPSIIYTEEHVGLWQCFYSKVEETFQIIQVQMRSNISSMYMYLQMHWHLDALQRPRTWRLRGKERSGFNVSARTRHMLNVRECSDGNI